MNLAASFDSLAQKIKSDGGADGLLPYKIIDIINQARDPHTSDLNDMFNGLNQDTMFLVNLNSLSEPANENTTRWLTLTDDGNNGVSVAVSFQDLNDGSKITESKIDTINGEDAFSFLVSLASNTGLDDPCTYKSFGVRLNSLMLVNSIVDPVIVMKFDFGSFGDISKLPPCLDVSFSNGKQEEWCFFIALYSAEEVAYSVEEWNNKTNQMDEDSPYGVFKTIIDVLNGDQDGIITVEDTFQRRRSLKALLPDETPEESEGNIMGFTWFYANSTDDDDGSPELLGGYVVKNDTLIFRYPGFGDTEDTIEMWKKIVEVATKENTTKLLIDIVGNGGGTVDTAYFLALALYPDMKFEDWINFYNFRVSENLDTILSVYPLFSETSELLDSNTKEYVSFLNNNPEIGAKSLKTVSNILKAIDIVLQGIQTRVSLNEKGLKQLQTAASSLAAASTMLSEGDQIDFENSALDVFGDALDLFEAAFTKTSRNNTNLREIIQGGSLVNVTEFYTWSDEEKFENLKKTAVVQNLPFESYVLLSDGLSGSSASIFENNVRSYAKKNAGNVTPAVGVSFGCAGEKETCPLTQYAGGSIADSRYFLGDAYLEAAVYLGLYSMILPFVNDTSKRSIQGNETLVEFKNGVDKLLLALPQPPIGAAQFPEYTVEMYYNNLMSPETLPAEYFNIPPDAYIKFWPKPGSILRGYSVASQESLPELYEKASQFFVMNNDSVEEMEENAPVMNDSVEEMKENSSSILHGNSCMLTTLLSIACLLLL